MKCRECDVDQIYCVRCAMRTAIHADHDGNEIYNAKEKRAAATEKPASSGYNQYTRCSYCDEAFSVNEWGQVDHCLFERISEGEREWCQADHCPIEHTSKGKRCKMGMMHTRCIQAHMLEHHPKIECPVRCRQQEQIRINNYEVALAESCLLYTSPSPRDRTRSRMPSSA